VSLEEIRPTGRKLVMDLVSQAGLDVSDWASCACFKGGAERVQGVREPACVTAMQHQKLNSDAGTSIQPGPPR
jgi:hypothetical protein